jgi:Amino acid transporters
MENQISAESFGYKQELKRSLSVRDLVIFGIVFMAPVSSMTLFGIMSMSSQGHNFMSYVVGFVAMFFTAYSYGKMVEAYPIAGSTYSYTQRAINPKLGFLSGWVMLLDYFLIPMLLYVVSANFANALLPQIPFWVWVLIYLLFVTIINILGIEVAAKANFIITALMLAAIFSFVIAAVHYTLTGTSGSLFSLQAIYNPANFAWSGILSGAVLAVSSYLGFDAITTMSEETKASSKNISKAILIACGVETVLYLLVAYFGTVVVPDFQSFANPDTAFFDIAFKVGGSALQIFITMVIVISGASTAMAGQSAASRLLYGMGRDQLIPSKFFAYLHPKFKTPVYNILFMGIIGGAGAMMLSMAILSEMVTFGGLFGFICVNLSVVSHYYIKNKSGNLLHVIFPLIGIVVCAFILYGMSPIAKTVGFSWLLLGIVYLAVRSLISDNFNVLLDKNTLVNPDTL